MMHLRRALEVFMFTFFLIGGWGHAYAQSHIKIESSLDPSPMASTYTQAGGWTITHATGGSYSCASGTGNQYTLAAVSGNPTLDVSDSVSPDLIRFHNVKITASGDVCGHIYFWAKVMPDPSGMVDFDLSSIGKLQSSAGGAAPGSWAHMSGWLQHYADGSLPGLGDGTSGAWEHVGTTSGPPVSASPQDSHAGQYVATNFNMSTDENPDLPGIINPRIMKGEIWFFLKNTHQLILNANTGVTVTTAAGGGGRDDDFCRHNLRPCISDQLEEVLGDIQVQERLNRLEKLQKLEPLPRKTPPCTGPAEKCPPLERQ